MVQSRPLRDSWMRLRARSEQSLWQGYAYCMYYGSKLLVGARVTRIDEGGAALLAGTDPIVVAANHLGQADAGVLAMSMPRARRRRIRLVGSQQMVSLWSQSSDWRTWVWHRLLTTLLFKSYRVLVVRGELTKAEAVNAMAQAYEEGETIMIFPEGSRGTEVSLKPLRSGVAELALATNAVIVPMRIDGTADALPNIHKLRPRPRITARIRPPLTARADETPEQLLQRLATTLSPDPEVRSAANRGPFPPVTANREPQRSRVR